MIDTSLTKTVNSSIITNHVKQPNSTSHLYNFDKANPSFLPSLLSPLSAGGGNRISKKTLAGRMSNFPLPLGW